MGLQGDAAMRMSKAAVSMIVWGAFDLGIGLGLLLVPNVLLTMVGLFPASDVWIRVLGLLTVILGLYQIACARQEVVQFFRITVPGRGVLALGLIAFAVFDLAGPSLVLFALLEALGAAWTWWALRTANP